MQRLHIVFLGLAMLLPISPVAAQSAPDPDSPELNFDFVWETLDRHYAMFDAKHVDWDAVRRVYRPDVGPRTTDDELFALTLDMLRHLNDAHVCLESGSRRVCSGFIEELERGAFSLELVRSKYLGGEASTAYAGRFSYGWLSDELGYVHMADMKDADEDPAAAIDTILASFEEAAGLIVDVRDNPGGTEATANLIANRFADRKRNFMRSRVRYGPEHGDFGPVRSWSVEPDGPRPFTRPTILLTNRFSESAADVFALAMRVLPHVTLVGDSTGGAFSSQAPVSMPNGWTLWVAFKLLVDNEGVCWDGIGVPPDLRIVNTPADIAAGRDRVLEFARRLLERGELQPQDERRSLEGLKTSLVAEFAVNLETHGLAAARTTLGDALERRDDANFFSGDEAIQLANEFLNAGRFDEVVVLTEATRVVFPEALSAYGLQAFAQLFAGDADAARATLAATEGLEPGLPWEAGMLAAVRARLE